jgi:hypothetical protein
MCPPLFGCRTNSDCVVCEVGQNLPSRLLGALPKRSWPNGSGAWAWTYWCRYGHAASKSEATRSRWQWTWVR